MPGRKIVVTSALPYANGEIHLGHVISTYLPADIFVRYCRAKRYNVIYVCATDDFGTPILIKAEQEGKRPQEYVDYWNKRDLEDFTGIGISFDIFHKTSSKENIELTKHFFLMLREKGYISTETIIQPYCKYDDKFLPDRYVIGTCPFCGAAEQYSDGCEKCGRTFQPGEIRDPRCAICGRPPVEKQSEHYFFRLSKLSGRLKDWLISNKNLQNEVKNYVLNWIESGLRDWDITRDIDWGVPIPLEEAKGKVLYGWFDNHLCYIATAILYQNHRGIDGKAFWNSADIYHFVGKDIVYHHYLFLPAMRLALDEEYKLPIGIPTRGHLLLQGQKFSKSRGWYLSLKDALDSFPADYLRYYMSIITSYSQSDVNFDWDEFYARINNELVANIGNFIHRTLTFVASRFGGRIPEAQSFEEDDKEIIEKVRRLPREIGVRIEANELDKALKMIVDFSAYCNQYFQRKEPWAKSDSNPTALHVSSNLVGALAILLSPYLPSSANRLWAQLGLEGSVFSQSWDDAGEMRLRAGHKIGKPEILFKKLDASEIERQKKKLGMRGNEV